MENLVPTELRSPNRSARGHSLFRLRCTGPRPCPCVKPEFIYQKRNSNTTLFLVINSAYFTIARYVFRNRSPSDQGSKKCKRKGVFLPLYVAPLSPDCDLVNLNM